MPAIDRSLYIVYTCRRLIDLSNDCRSRPTPKSQEIHRTRSTRRPSVPKTPGSGRKRAPPPLQVIIGPNPPMQMARDVAHVIIQSARWVAVQGDEFERTLETKYANDPRFSFLFQRHSRGAEYYRARLLCVLHSNDRFFDRT